MKSTEETRVTTRIAAKVSTADSNKKEIIGKVRLPVCYHKRTEELDIYIVPTFKQNLYLGIDFWRKFNPLPILACVSELDLKSVEHDLSSVQKTQLASIVNLFPSFTKEGLGKTGLITHVIDVGMAKIVKQRHYPVSKAMESLYTMR